MASLLTSNKILTIEGVKTALYLGKCVLNKNTKVNRFWEMDWEKDQREKIKANAGRIYIIVSRNENGLGEIKKIGKSECKGGMKGTFSFYQGGLNGSPSIRTFGIHHLIKQELDNGNKIEIYGIWSKPVKINVPGLFEETEMEVTPSIHCMEDKCRNDYKIIMKDYPPWNFQERGISWPNDILEQYKTQVVNR